MTATTNKNGAARSCNSGDAKSTNPAQINAQETDMSSMTEKAPDLNDHDGIPPIDRPCPHWCELGPGHGWESTWGDYTRVSRFHVQHVSPADADQYAIADGAEASVMITSEETAPLKDCGHPKPTYERDDDGRLVRIACDCPPEADGFSEFSTPTVSSEIPDELSGEAALQVVSWLRLASERVSAMRLDWIDDPQTRHFAERAPEDPEDEHGEMHERTISDVTTPYGQVAVKVTTFTYDHRPDEAPAEVLLAVNGNGVLILPADRAGELAGHLAAAVDLIEGVGQ